MVEEPGITVTILHYFHFAVTMLTRHGNSSEIQSLTGLSRTLTPVVT